MAIHVNVQIAVQFYLFARLSVEEGVLWTTSHILSQSGLYPQIMIQFPIQVKRI